MRDSGKASRSAVQGVIKDLEDYEFVIDNELELILKEIDELSGVWNDNNFKLLWASVDNIKSNIMHELETVRHARHELEKKVSLM